MYWSKMKIHLKNSETLPWSCPDLNNATHGQINSNFLCLPSIQTTFVWNIFSEDASLKKYFGATFKMGHPVHNDYNDI